MELRETGRTDGVGGADGASEEHWASETGGEWLPAAALGLTSWGLMSCEDIRREGMRREGMRREPISCVTGARGLTPPTRALPQLARRYVHTTRTFGLVSDSIHTRPITLGRGKFLGGRLRQVGTSIGSNDSTGLMGTYRALWPRGSG